MREILFRGKDFSGLWHFGNLISFYPDAAVIVRVVSDFNVKFESILIETVGQYTGLTDKNGNKIFEGDIVRYTRTNMYAPSCSFHKQDLVSIHLMLWDSSVSAFVQQHYELNGKRIIGKGSAVLYDDRAEKNIIEVIGNIHDNPELLKGCE